MDMLAQFKADRSQAFELKDEMAAVCTVANTDSQGTVQMRTLVLRAVGEELAIFINSTSPKWPHLQEQVSFLTYWPTVKLQYRILARASEVAPEIVRESWLLRPPAPKQMDWFYSNVATQSSTSTSRETLLQQVDGQRLPEPLVAPDTARGLILSPYSIERLDLNQENGIHDRRLANLSASGWQEEVLVP